MIIVEQLQSINAVLVEMTKRNYFLLVYFYMGMDYV